MIRLAVMSDIHNEFESPTHSGDDWFALRDARRAIPDHPEIGPLLDDLAGQSIDLVVMAGDIDLEDRGIAYTDKVSSYVGAPVVCVMGNRESYTGRDMDAIVSDLRAGAGATNGRVTFLENEKATYDLPAGRLYVLGCTLWTDYALNGAETVEQAMLDCADLNDHTHIQWKGDRFLPAHARQLHETSRQWLAREVGAIRAAEGDGATIIIVTHHAPILDSIDPQFRSGKLSPAFASDLHAEIREWKPAAWLFGHTHHSVDLMIDNTRMLSVQRGFVCQDPGAERFRPVVVEIHP
ncbi:MAG: metallophosphoesterase [Desulfobacterium sp.]|nr:metallophosphoesterase [Desulfobacterium sp.]